MSEILPVQTAHNTSGIHTLASVCFTYADKQQEFHIVTLPFLYRLTLFVLREVLCF